jgi:hypothetical protein
VRLLWLTSVDSEYGFERDTSPTYQETNDVNSYIGNITIRPIEGLILAVYYDSEPGDGEQNETAGVTVHYERGKFALDAEYIGALSRENHFSDNREYKGWDEQIGLKTEIVPLSKPYGLYAGNVFQGIVKLDGEPVPFCEVEVEYFNEDGKAQAPTDYMITQTIKADANGVFTYGVPKAGWWGFAALNTSEEKIKGKDVEIGAVLWVRFHEWK